MKPIMEASATPRITKSKGSSDLPFVLALLGVLDFAAAVADADVAAVVEVEAMMRAVKAS